MWAVVPSEPLQLEGVDQCFHAAARSAKSGKDGNDPVSAPQSMPILDMTRLGAVRLLTGPA